MKRGKRDRTALRMQRDFRADNSQPRGAMFRDVAALDQIDTGDVLKVSSLDPIARSTHDLPNTSPAITGEKARIRSLSHIWANTTTAHGRLMLIVLGSLAEFERELIPAPTGDRGARAVPDGVKMGRKPKSTRHQSKKALKRHGQGKPVRKFTRNYDARNGGISRLAA
jgi:DNA invertase Pin-like site-specific DNA recombinase